MLIRRIEGCTRVLGAPKDWNHDDIRCVGLPIRDVPTDEGNVMISAWEPTPEEIEALQRGESIKLWVFGTGHPAVYITVDDK